MQGRLSSVQSDKAETFKNIESTLVFGSRNPFMCCIITKTGDGRQKEHRTNLLKHETRGASCTWRWSERRSMTLVCYLCVSNQTRESWRPKAVLDRGLLRVILELNEVPMVLVRIGLFVFVRHSRLSRGSEGKWLYLTCSSTCVVEEKYGCREERKFVNEARGSFFFVAPRKFGVERERGCGTERNLQVRCLERRVSCLSFQRQWLCTESVALTG